ncbi:hypothetical protein EH240_30760 [Mesorhizobium tamadayense]|uniref:Uncharacterized protein n=1 Tax=Mesorhizobium tamadayense TaxID=425306 RepID=A0A3P3F399_9HYPH|nr:hypothetical protein [Mesorhizobium tamadayense]RRH92927.1 hypothetical protein EH240_30760 [Mesorhizobium tamadayense]
MAMLGFVKPAQDKLNGSSLRESVPAEAPEELRRAMLEFVEALAVADARRDHRIAIGVSIDSAFDADHA